MERNAWTNRAVMLAVAATLCAAGWARAAEPTTTTPDVQTELQALKARIAELERKDNEDWMTAERTSQIKAIVNECLADAKIRGMAEDSSLQAGYKNGFFIQTADQMFTFKFNGFIQYRYTFSHDALRNAAAFGSTPPAHGDTSGFDFRYARLTFDGNLFTPDLTYLFTGDFATDGSDLNNFQLVDGYLAYRFDDALNVRAGAFITPFSRVIYIASGLQFIDFPTVFNPFNPDRSMGLSVYGDLIKDKLTYDVNVNDGAKSNHLGRAEDSSSTGGMDNRLSFASRWQYFGGTGTPADYADESDLRKDNTTFSWMLGAGVDYDSVNASSNAFPAKEGSSTIAGVSTSPSPGFLGSYPLNGDIYRGTIDASFKYYGFAFTGASFIQQINENTGAGITYPAGYNPISNKSSFFMFANYGQIGYMLSKQWEVVARAGSLSTEGGPNTMQEYAVGVNYYIYGKNVKLQTDVTFIPNEAAYSSSTFNTIVNTEDLVVRFQLQAKF